MRTQVIREREIAGSLVHTLKAFREFVPGLYSIGVGIRGDRGELTAVITAEERVGAAEQKEVRRVWEDRVQVPSPIPVMGNAAPVQIVVEQRPAPTLLGKVPANHFIFGEPDPTPQNAPVLQSGDKIGSESPSGIREFGTIACIVHEQRSTTPLLLASGHVLRQKGWNVVSGRTTPPQVIGRVKGIDSDMDVGIAEISQPYLCDFRIKGSDLVPASPVIATNDMQVQMFGALSERCQHPDSHESDAVPATPLCRTRSGCSRDLGRSLSFFHRDWKADQLAQSAQGEA